MDVVLYNPESPDMDICETDYPSSPEPDVAIKFRDGIPSSPPLIASHKHQLNQIPQTSSDPLTGTTYMNKRDPSCENIRGHSMPPSKKRSSLLKAQINDDNSSDIIANAPRLDSSRFARPEHQTKSPFGDDCDRSSHAYAENHRNNSENLEKTVPTSVKEELYIARDHIVRAYHASVDRNEQTKLLDLLDIFREYTERGFLNKASTIIASQVANLETATRQIENKAKDLKRIITPAIPIPQKSQRGSENQQTSPPQQSSLASIAGKNIDKTNHVQEWTTVGKKNTPQSRALHASQSRSGKTKRVILIQDPSNATLTSPLNARNHINQAFAAKGVKGPVVALVSKTHGNNIAITTTGEYSADFLIEKKEIWQSIIPHNAVQKDEPWFKIVAHGIPLADFNNDHGMEMIKDEVTTFNKGLKPIGMPYWISTAENRQVNKAGSVAIAFGTEEEANRAIRNRLYIAGISVRVTKFHTVAPTTQCINCQGFGHLDSYCRKEAKCSLCGDKHNTQQHYCSVCKAKGKSCSHLSPKCANCSGDHKANFKSCQIYLAIKNKDEESEI